MEWAAGLALVPRNLLAVGAYGVALVAVTPTLRAHRWVLGPALIAVAALGTLGYVRYGLLVLTGPCEACGERAYVGALWCDRFGAVRTTVSRPLVQLALAVGLFLSIGAVAGAVRTLALWVAAEGGPAWTYLRTGGDGLFRATVLAAAMIAAVPVPLLAGNLLGRSLVESGGGPAAE